MSEIDFFTVATISLIFFFYNHLFAKTHYLHYGLNTSLDNTVQTVLTGYLHLSTIQDSNYNSTHTRQ